MGLIRYLLYCVLLINGLLHTSRLKTTLYAYAAPDNTEGKKRKQEIFFFFFDYSLIKNKIATIYHTHPIKIKNFFCLINIMRNQ